MPEPVRVLWVAKGLGQGGMERLLVNHALFGDRGRFDYHAAFLVRRPFDVTAELLAAGVTLHDLQGRRLSSLGWLRRLVTLVRTESIDVVHTHSPLVAAMVRPVLRSLPHRPALVYTEHNSWDNYRVATRTAHGLTSWLDDARVAVSDPASASPPRWVIGRSEPLIHGIDIDGVAALSSERAAVRAELTVADDTFVVGTVANFRPSKAYPVMLDAAHLVRQERSDVVFVSVGQGPLQSEIEERKAAMGLGDSFRILGFRADARRVMAGFDLFVLSSAVEGLPVAVMEAKALGLPIVATAVGGLPDAVATGVEGILVRPGSPRSLADAVLAVANDPVLAARLGSASRQSAGRYDARLAVEHLERIYQDRAR